MSEDTERLQTIEATLAQIVTLLNARANPMDMIAKVMESELAQQFTEKGDKETEYLHTALGDLWKKLDRVEQKINLQSSKSL